MLRPTARTSSVALLLAVAALLACSPESVNAPAAPRVHAGDHHASDLLPVQVSVMRRKYLLHSPLTWTFVVDPNGTVVNNPTLGLHMRFPKGAVTTSTTITVSAPAGPFVAYDFAPQGLVFHHPVWIRQWLARSIVPSDSALEGAYYGSGLPIIDPLTGILTVQEFEPTSIVGNGNVARFSITHFSGYVVATGRH